MEMPCLYEDGYKIEINISYLVGYLNLEGDINLWESL